MDVPHPGNSFSSKKFQKTQLRFWLKMTILDFSRTDRKIRQMSHRRLIVENMPKMMARNVFHQCRGLPDFFGSFFHSLIHEIFLVHLCFIFGFHLEIGFDNFYQQQHESNRCHTGYNIKWKVFQNNGRSASGEQFFDQKTKKTLNNACFCLF